MGVGGILDEIFDGGLDVEISLEDVLSAHAGLSEAEAAVLRNQLKGTTLLIGAEECLRLRKFAFPTSDTLELIMALLCANFRDCVRMQQEDGWPY